LDKGGELTSKTDPLPPKPELKTKKKKEKRKKERKKKKRARPWLPANVRVTAMFDK